MPAPPGTYLGYSGKNGEPSGTPVPAGAGYGQGLTFYKAPDAVSYVSGMQENEVKLLQQRLVDAGYAPKGGLIAGVWNTDSQKSLAKAMADSNQAGGIGVDAILAKAASPDSGVGGAAGSGGSSTPKSGRIVDQPNLVTGGHTIELTAPQDIEKGASDTFSKLLGRNIRGDETLQIVQQLQNIDRLNQATKFGQEDATKGATFMQDMAKSQQEMALLNQGSASGQSDVMGQPVIPPGIHPIGGMQTQLPNAETTQAPNPQAYAEWVIKTQLPNEYLGAQMADRARTMGDFLSKQTPIGSDQTLAYHRV